MTTRRFYNEEAAEPEFGNESEPIRSENSAVFRRHSLRGGSDSLFREEEFDGGNSFRASAGCLPKTILRIPDCSDEMEEPVKKISADLLETNSFTGRKHQFVRAKLTLFWMSGVCIGLLGGILLYSRIQPVSFTSPAENSGEYTVSKVEEPSEIPISEMEQAPVREKFAAVSAAAWKGADSIPEWNGEKFEAIDTAPLWEPKNGADFSADDCLVEEAAPFSFRENEQEEPTLSFKEGREYFDSAEMAESEISVSDYESPIADSTSRDFTEQDSFAADAAAAAVPQEFAYASDRPMKNQVEYFEPFETDSSSSEAEPVRIAASDDFYQGSSVGSFSDYIPPQNNQKDRNDNFRFSEDR